MKVCGQNRKQFLEYESLMIGDKLLKEVKSITGKLQIAGEVTIFFPCVLKYISKKLLIWLIVNVAQDQLFLIHQLKKK